MKEAILQSHQLKVTKNRMIILTILENSILPLTAEDIYDTCLKTTKMNYSTVYRTLSVLYDKGILLKTYNLDGILSYKLNSNDHKHFLTCTKCNKSIPIAFCPLTALETNLAEETGFQITGHNLEITGLCPDCIKQNTQSKKQK
ncbi:Fur family transcriptional regulator [Anaeromicropila populeti]|uniref:Fur family transcriptional regulator, ferric uptake regulator n=1 Tax=Anaeromicropila populeti TaxID=37658 RepID=A0A1I6JII8_9FIRM|nr:Fur family transcriptional regulator [Anaeromicropila populeti]SFR78775.1 Fur family transcriptional regulator, ferric uptake regulator [Anaeromicropila populeti]